MEETTVTETTVHTNGETSVVKETITNVVRVAVVKAPRRKWYSQVWAKIVGIVTGNAAFLWLWSQLAVIQGFELHPYVWRSIWGMVGIGSLLWVGHEIWETNRYNNNQDALDTLLVEQNSVPENLAQLIPADEVDLYRARGFKIITRGEKA